MILTSMSECRNETRYSPINAELNGISFTSGNYTYTMNMGGSPFYFHEYESDLVFHFEREIVSDDDRVKIIMNLRSELPFELNRQYAIGTKEGSAKIIFWEDRVQYRFMSTGGYVVFIERTGTSGSVLSGRFEFTSRNEEKDSVINVTNGTFENLHCYLE